MNRFLNMNFLYLFCSDCVFNLALFDLYAYRIIAPQNQIKLRCSKRRRSKSNWIWHWKCRKKKQNNKEFVHLSTTSSSSSYRREKLFNIQRYYYLLVHLINKSISRYRQPMWNECAFVMPVIIGHQRRSFARKLCVTEGAVPTSIIYHMAVCFTAGTEQSSRERNAFTKQFVCVCTTRG